MIVWFRAIDSGMDGTSTVRGARATQRRAPGVTKVLPREEAEFAQFQQAGTVPASVPPYQVGRTPTL